MFSFFFEVYCDHRDRHVLTHSCPTRRSSDLACATDGSRRRSIPSSARRRATRGQLPRFFSGGERRFRQSRKRLRMRAGNRSEEHTSELQSLMRISYAVFCLKKKKKIKA